MPNDIAASSRIIGVSTANPEPLSVRGVELRFGQHAVLRGVDLDLHSGELLGLVGRNGAGKSTLVRIVTRVLRPQAGTIHVLGVSVERLSAQDVARRIAVVPQTAELPPGFTALEIVLMGRTPHLPLLGSEGERDVEIARQAMLQTDTWTLNGRQVDQLSGGERQRLLLARALAQETPLLLLDEPTTHLDIGHQAELLNLLAGLRHERGLSVLAVVHDLSLAAHYCDRLALLDGGKIVVEGAPAEVLTGARVSAVYETEVLVIPHPITGRPVILPGS